MVVWLWGGIDLNVDVGVGCVIFVGVVFLYLDLVVEFVMCDECGEFVCYCGCVEWYCVFVVFEG